MSLKDLLSHIPANQEFPVDLPSKGRFYKSFDAKTGVTVKPITFEIEMSLVPKKEDRNFNSVDHLLKQCVKGVDLGELLVMDRFAILLKLREVSYGNEYKSNAECKSCGTDNTLNYSLKDLPVKYVEDTLTDPRTIDLPILKKKAVVRSPRQEDIDFLGDVPVGDSLWRFIVSIDGIEDKAEIAQTITDARFPLRDIKALVDGVLLSSYGIQTDVAFRCSNESCGAVNEARFGINPDFFSFNM